MVHQWTVSPPVWCISVMCGASIDYVSLVYRVVYRCSGWCISGLSDVSFGCVMYQMAHQCVVSPPVWCISVMFGASIDYVRLLYRMAYQCSEWCISVLCGASVDYVVDCVVHQCTVWCTRWCISVLCGASVYCVVHHWIVGRARLCISRLCGVLVYAL